ncbi:MAG: polysaccharide deacetylase family protein [Treponema sp.]|nr:polysaccharide deacetylase family protein [Treponema sp.]
MSVGKKYLALSFDDGPNCTTTVHDLDLLEQFCIPASFFLIGQNITEQTVPVIKRQLELGCTVECHSWCHPHMGSMGAEEIKSEVLRTDTLIEKYTGRIPEFFRPPYIDLSETLYKSVDKPFICGADCQDWEDSVSCGERVRMVLDSAREGQIFLLHDTKGNEKTVEALKQIIPALLDRGFTFVTVPELFKLYGVNPHVRGKIWSNVLD